MNSRFLGLKLRDGTGIFLHSVPGFLLARAHDPNPDATPGSAAALDSWMNRVLIRHTYSDQGVIVGIGLTNVNNELLGLGPYSHEPGLEHVLKSTGSAQYSVNVSLCE